jgi:hypothetical protein
MIMNRQERQQERKGRNENRLRMGIRIIEQVMLGGGGREMFPEKEEIETDDARKRTERRENHPPRL